MELPQTYHGVRSNEAVGPSLGIWSLHQTQNKSEDGRRNRQQIFIQVVFSSSADESARRAMA